MRAAAGLVALNRARELGRSVPVVLVFLLCADGVSGQSTPDEGTCYDVDFTPPATWPESSRSGFHPPPAVRLDMTPYEGSGAPENARVLSVPRGSVPSDHDQQYWFSAPGDTLALVWSFGFHGLEARVGEVALEGVANGFSDLGSPDGARVRLRAVGCEAYSGDSNAVHGRVPNSVRLIRRDSLWLGQDASTAPPIRRSRSPGTVASKLWHLERDVRGEPLDAPFDLTPAAIGLRTGASGRVNWILLVLPGDIDGSDFVHRMEAFLGPADDLQAGGRFHRWVDRDRALAVDVLGLVHLWSVGPG